MATRPTTERVKEALFSAIQFDIPDKKVLDLFAGSGQLGIEALSRGAAEAVFVDASPQAVSIIRDNLARSGFSKQAKVYSMDYTSFLRKNTGQFDLIFLDPPYAGELLNQALEQICAFDILSPYGIIAAETHKDNGFTVPTSRKYQVRTYGFGVSRVHVIRFQE